MLGKRSFLKGLAATAAALPSLSAGGPARARSDTGYPRLLLGPMVGATGPTSVTIWGMVSGAFPVTVQVITELEAATPLAEATVEADGAGPVAVTIEGLAPATRYAYRVLVAGERDRYRRGQPLPTVKTAPAVGAASNFRLAFGSCARFQADAVQHIWATVAAAQPDLFLWLGDNIYADSLVPRVLDLEYQRQRAVAAYQPVARSVSNLAVWDDHDFGLNNHDRTNPVKEAGLAAFKRYWANPAYGLADTPGVFFRHSYGAVDLFCLDGRFYRDPNSAEDGPDKTLLGAAQLSWLKSELKASDAIFKVLACGSGWSAAKGPGGDSWAAFLHERDALFDFIRDEDIRGVVLISGDTHVAELNCIPRSQAGGYDLYDVVSSPLAQRPSLSWVKRTPEVRIRRPFPQDNNVGLLEFDFSADPTVTASVRGTDGRLGYPPLTLRASDLQNGVSSWQRLQQL